MEGQPRQRPACLGKLLLNWRVAGVQSPHKKCASHRPPEQEEKGSGALGRVPRGRHYPCGLESKTAPVALFCSSSWATDLLAELIKLYKGNSGQGTSSIVLIRNGTVTSKIRTYVMYNSD
ncbi:hypothetical protein J6590_089041 [Homalodisca vitripennis]|nr:hypothetical protein J6590_089041 [Homalodisca vitripennis]